MTNTITPKHLWVIAGAFWAIAITCAAISGFFFSSHEVPLTADPNPQRATALQPIPKSFLQSPSLAEALNFPGFLLASIDRPIRLPDLRSTMTFYGSNERPDRSPKSRRIQFGVRGSPTISSTIVGEKVFFKFDLRANRWTVSDTPTPLVAVFSPKDPQVEVLLEFHDGKGGVITDPYECHYFLLAQSGAPVQGCQPQQWLVGTFPVDNSLLDRQGAVWWGQDEVVQAFGGDEMKHEASRQRVQFGTGEDAYVLWVGEGDCFAYDDGIWKAAEPGSETVGKPLLKATGVDERAIHFQLWNPEGTSHHSLDLLHREAQGEVKVPEIKVIGARSKKHWIAEIQGKRVTLSPDDWVLLTQDGFTQIDDAQLLDEYLQGRLCGNLLAFSGIEKVDGELCLVGTFYDSTRTRQAPFAISLYRSWKKDRSNAVPSSESDDSDEDELSDGDDVEEIELDDDDDDDED